MSEIKGNKIMNTEESLFNSISEIINTAKQNIIRSVNINMVIAYWLTGREIVLSVQDGSERAEYGKEILRNISKRLNEKFGSGFSTTSLKYFRTFYAVYKDRVKGRPLGDEFDLQIGRPSGDELIPDFHPNLSWSHYRALMRVRTIRQDNFMKSKQ